ncbi:MAG: Sporulation and spore germination [Firmicutes bacterium]|nr:Sporulation and spore germination [Bacillota bacterium]
MKSKVKALLLIILLLVLVAVAGCDKPADQPVAQPADTAGVVQEQQQKAGAPVGETQKIIVYRATKDAKNLVPETHVVPKTNHPAKDAVELLLTDSKTTDAFSVLPVGTKLKGLSVKDGIAYVDFNDKLTKNSGGGSADEILIVAAIVDTLTEFPDIEKVQIMVEGKKVDTLTGHLDVSEPLSRSERIIKKSL